MKKLLIAAGIFISSASFAQTERNSWLVGGGVSLRTGQNSGEFSFNPTAGLFIADNFLFGGNINFDYIKQGTVKATAFGVGPIARYYFGHSNTKPFVVSEFNFETLNTKNTNSNTEIKTNGFNFLVGLGFAAFLNRNIAIEGVSGYSYSKYKEVDGSSGFNLRLGFGLYFNRKSVKDLKSNMMENK